MICLMEVCAPRVFLFFFNLQSDHTMLYDLYVNDWHDRNMCYPIIEYHPHPTPPTPDKVPLIPINYLSTEPPNSWLSINLSFSYSIIFQLGCESLIWKSSKHLSNNILPLLTPRIHLTKYFQRSTSCEEMQWSIFQFICCEQLVVENPRNSSYCTVRFRVQFIFVSSRTQYTRVSLMLDVINVRQVIVWFCVTSLNY